MIKFLSFLWRLFFPKKVLPDSVKVPSTPAPDVKVVEPVLKDRALPWYFQPEMLALLRLIIKHEGGKAGYNADYANNDKWNLDAYNLDEVIALSKSQVRRGEPSSAIGAYQFLSKTLESLKTSLNLSGKERFTPSFQDDLAIALMIRRGLMKFLRHEISLPTFTNNLAMEWASLPVVAPAPKGKTVGRSYYAGDGLNKSFHSPVAVLEAVTKMGNALRPVMPKGV